MVIDVASMTSSERNAVSDLRMERDVARRQQVAVHLVGVAAQAERVTVPVRRTAVRGRVGVLQRGVHRVVDRARAARAEHDLVRIGIQRGDCVGVVVDVVTVDHQVSDVCLVSVNVVGERAAHDATMCRSSRAQSEAESPPPWMALVVELSRSAVS
jgi:hypothetical protein